MKKCPNLDAIVFDVGNVLLRFDPLAHLRTLYEGSLAVRIHDAVFASPHWTELDRSVLTFDEIVARMAADTPDMAQWILPAFSLYQDILHPMEDTIAYLPKLKAAGYPLYILSNYGKEYFAKTRALYPFFDVFDGMIISGEHQVLKPDPAIYLLLLHQFGLTASRTLFLDDRQDNIEGARAVGLQGLQFTHSAQLQSLLLPDA